MHTLRISNRTGNDKLSSVMFNQALSTLIGSQRATGQLVVSHTQTGGN